MTLPPAEKFSVLGVETRVRIIELLKRHDALGSKCIAARIGISAAAVSQHLKTLKQAGLVTCQRSGNRIPYSLNQEALEDCRRVLSRVCACSTDKLQTVRASEKELKEASLSCLKKYKKGLEREVGLISQRIEELESG